MSLAVVAYPKLSRKDHEWIQSFRSLHDELYYSWVEPHFSLVFPTARIETEPMVRHVTSMLRGEKAIPIVMRTAQAGDDAFSDYHHVFFVPDEGHNAIVRLHDRLYSGILKKELRSDIPYVPHLGIGNQTDRRICQQWVDELNAMQKNICGGIYEIEVISIERQIVMTEAVLPLSP